MLRSRKNHASRSASHSDLLQPQQKLLYDLEFFLAAVLLIGYIGLFVRVSHSQYRHLHHPDYILRALSLRCWQNWYELSRYLPFSAIRRRQYPDVASGRPPVRSMQCGSVPGG